MVRYTLPLIAIKLAMCCFFSYLFDQMEFVVCNFNVHAPYIIPYNPLEDKDPLYSQFERMVLHQLHELNVS